MTAPPRFGLNRFDACSVDAFAADVRRAEVLGWDAAVDELAPGRTLLAWGVGDDLEASGRVVDFLPEAAVDAFCLRGGSAEVVAQLIDVLRSAPASFDYVCLLPIPNPTAPDDPERGFMARVAREVLPPVRAAFSAGAR